MSKAAPRPGGSTTGNTGKAASTDPEHAGQKRSLEFLAEDCKRLCVANIFTPFVNLQDAVERLFPFHVLSHMDGEEADADEAVDLEGCRFLAGRYDNSQELSARQAVELTRRLDVLRQKVVKVQQHYRSRRTSVNPEEEMMVQQMVVHESKRLFEIEQARPPDPGVAQAAARPAAPAAVKQETPSTAPQPASN